MSLSLTGGCSIILHSARYEIGIRRLKGHQEHQNRWRKHIIESRGGTHGIKNTGAAVGRHSSANERANTIHYDVFADFQYQDIRDICRYRDALPNLTRFQAIRAILTLAEASKVMRYCHFHHSTPRKDFSIRDFPLTRHRGAGTGWVFEVVEQFDLVSSVEGCCHRWCSNNCRNKISSLLPQLPNISLHMSSLQVRLEWVIESSIGQRSMTLRQCGNLLGPIVLT
jgi:hypothetical protein